MPGPRALESFSLALVYHRVLLPPKGTLFSVGGAALEPGAHTNASRTGNGVTGTLAPHASWTHVQGRPGPMGT